MDKLVTEILSLMKDGKSRSLKEITNILDKNRVIKNIGTGIGVGTLLTLSPVIGAGIAGTAAIANKKFTANIKEAIEVLEYMGLLTSENEKFVITKEGLAAVLSAVITSADTTIETTATETENTPAETTALNHEQSTAQTPYEGDKPYIFISYSHVNKNEVFDVVKILQQNGYRVWYDEGIHPGAYWTKFIAEKINKCGLFIAFISEEFLSSENCLDELFVSKKLNKDRVLLYLTDVELPLDLILDHGRRQAIQKFKFSNGEFEKILLLTEGLDSCKD